MTKKEIEKNIKKEEKRITRLRSKIINMEFDIKACEGAIVFWKEQLKKTLDN